MKQAIGFIDSGVGGLTVVREALRQLPYESIIYLGDSARCPYGPRPAQEVIDYTWEMVHFLLSKDVKMIVVACNTATALVLDQLKEKLSIPVVGVINPGSLAAIKQTQNNHIAVLGTKGTINSGVYQKKLQEKNQKVHVENLACPKFVPLVESNQINSSLAKKVVAETLLPLKHKKIDTVVLGCTHYPLLRDTIQNVLGQEVKLIDSGAETLTAVSTLLDYFELSETFATNPNPTREYYTTGSSQLFKTIAQEWLGDSGIDVKKVQLQAVNSQERRQKGENSVSDKVLVIATKNKGKAKEFKEIFEPKGFEVKTLLDYPEIKDVEETGKTFAENARLKAETIADRLQTMVLADDSGLSVDFLNGQPGVFSARYAGQPTNDAANNAKLLAELGGLDAKDRKASFHCCLALAYPEVESLVVIGIVEGYIAPFPQGENGFGYDPLFFVEDFQKTFAQLTPAEKNMVSHRGRAITLLDYYWDEWSESNGINK